MSKQCKGYATWLGALGGAVLLFGLYYVSTYSEFGHQAWVRTLLLPALLGGCIGYIAVQQLAEHRGAVCAARARNEQEGPEPVGEATGEGNKKTS